MGLLLGQNVSNVNHLINTKREVDEKDELSYQGAMEIGDLIRQRLRENKSVGKEPSSGTKLGEMLGISSDNMNKKLRGRHGFDPKELAQIAEILSLPIASLYGKKSGTFEPIQPVLTILGKFSNIPEGVRAEEYLATPLVEGEIAAGFPAEIPEEYVIGMVWVYKPEIGRRQYHNLRAVKLRKDAISMIPLIRPGDIVIVDPTEIPPHKPLSKNAIYAVKVENEGGFTLKKVREADNYWVFISENQEKDPILVSKDRVDNPFVGRVIWSWTSWIR